MLKSEKLPKMLKLLNKVDWILGFGVIAAGIYLEDWRVLASGFLGLAVAYYKPADRIKARLEAKLLRKTESKNASVTALVAEDTPPVEELSALESSTTPTKHASFKEEMQGGQILLGGSRHNVLKPSHLNMVVTKRSTWA